VTDAHPRSRPGARPWSGAVDALLLAAAVLAGWQALHMFAGDVALASPAATAARMRVLAGRPGFWAEAGSTAAAFLASGAIAVLGGVALGCLLGLSRVAGRVMEPILGALYALPKVTLYPVVLLLFGLGAAAKIAFGVMHGLIPIGLVTMNAVLQVRPVHMRTARAMRLGRAQTVLRVVVPSILPDVLGGLRIGVPLALLGVLIGEMFASRRGLGHLAMRAMETNDTPTLMAIAVLLTAAALAVNGCLSWLQARTV
jgi:NitT/TauT family transport system permease protein